MAFNIRQLDNLDYDTAEPLIEDYIFELINLFAVSKIGQAHVKQYPEGGDWIGTFIEMAYMYCDQMTLPKMTKADAQTVMEYILPRKLTLMDPADTDDAIPELVAFWNFLKAEYKLKSAGAISKYLASIEDKFSQWMFDPAKGGIAKSFILQGAEAGYDMGNQADLEAFQAEYNRQIKAARAEEQMPGLSATLPDGKITLQPGPGNLNKGAMASLPSDVEAMFNMLGIETPDPNQQNNPTIFAAQMIEAMDKVATALDLSGADLAELRALQSEMADTAELAKLEIDELSEPLSEEAIALLHAQTITDTEPGTIVKDFQTFLEAIGDKGVTVSNKRQQPPPKFLTALNEQLTHPIKIDLQRPQQKSFSNIHGLYLLLRATGIGCIVQKGKQHRLMLNADIYESWQQLNPTERYCTLLEAWLVRSDREMLGEDRYSGKGEGSFCLEGWPRFAAKKLSYSRYDYQDNIRYYPSYFNLALMELFGLVTIKSGKPSKGKGWRIKSVEAVPFGNALMTCIRNGFISRGFLWEVESNPSQPFDELQLDLQPYFPEWQKTLAVPEYPFSPENHIFKVTLGNIWRRIEIQGKATMAQLGSLIRESVNFDEDHLDQFSYTNHIGRTVQIDNPYLDGMSDLFTDEVTVGSLPLSVGDTLEYRFDFGAGWRFGLQLESQEPLPEAGLAKIKNTRGRKKATPALGRVIESHGEAPLQYPNDDW